MTPAQKIIKYIALAFAVCLIVGIISGIIKLIGGISFILSRKDKSSTKENEFVELIEADTVSILDIELEYAQLIIKKGDCFKAETTDKTISIKSNKAKLTIKESNKIFHSTEGETVILYIPESHQFESVEIESGAGTVEIETLNVKKLSLDLGAGKATFNELLVSESADIDCGTGLTAISGGEIRNLDIDVGVGKLEITSKLTGNCSIDNGIGSAEIKVLNHQDLYTVETSNGIGTISINGQNVSQDIVIGTGENLIKISGGIGNVNLLFE